MTVSFQGMGGAAMVGLAVVIATWGDSRFATVGIASTRQAVKSPKEDDGGQKAAAASQHLEGVVRDDDGWPVAGATVVAGKFGGGKPNHRIGKTGADGRFDLAPDERSAHLQYVVAYKEGLAAASFFDPLVRSRVEDGEIVLRLRKPVMFKGVVKDGKGKPIAGAVVKLRHAKYRDPDGKTVGFNVIEHIVLGTPLESVFRATSDAQGGFVFGVLPDAAQASLVVKAAGMGEYNTMNRPGPNGQFDYLQVAADTPAEVILRRRRAWWGVL